jgi:hypothetical protein
MDSVPLPVLSPLGFPSARILLNSSKYCFMRFDDYGFLTKLTGLFDVLWLDYSALLISGV